MYLLLTSDLWAGSFWQQFSVKCRCGQRKTSIGFTAFLPARIQGTFKDFPKHECSLSAFLKDKLNIIRQCSLGTKFRMYLFRSSQVLAIIISLTRKNQLFVIWHGSENDNFQGLFSRTLRALKYGLLHHEVIDFQSAPKPGLLNKCWRRCLYSVGQARYSEIYVLTHSLRFHHEGPEMCTIVTSSLVYVYRLLKHQ